jgi:anti-sigma factor RsiW
MEQDQLLDSYLDQALTADESAELEARLQLEPELAGRLDELRHERNIRQKVWQLMEPTELQGEQFNDQLKAQIQARDPWLRRVRVLRWAGAVAACLLIGFMSGYVNRGTLFGPDVPAGTSQVRMVSDTSDGGHRGYHVSLVDETGQVIATQTFDTLEQAQEFANDVGRWQATRRQAQDGHIQFVADQF